VVAGTAEREGEGEKKIAKTGGKGVGFLADFEPDFLPSQGMKCTRIYRRSKRNNLYLMVPNRGFWFAWEGSQPLVQSVHRELVKSTVKGCLSWPF